MFVKTSVNLFLMAALLMLMTACTTNHYSQALLYNEKSNAGNAETHSNSDASKTETYTISDSWNNPVYVDEESAFKVTINALNPGWIHWDTGRDTLKEGKARRLRENTTQHIVGKELWLLTKVESLSAEDILERNSKFYFKATNVKFSSGSFKPISLDVDEQKIFHHRADSPYRITFKLYEVDGFNLKKTLLRAHDSSPGLAGLLISTRDVLASAAEGLLGSIIADLWKKGSEDQLFVERVLLESGGSLEFKGSVLVLRKNGMLNKTKIPIMTDSYLLYDPFKSTGVMNGFKNKEQYSDAMAKLPIEVKLGEGEKRAGCIDGSDSVAESKFKQMGASCQTYIKLSVTQAYPPDSDVARALAKTADARNLVKISDISDKALFEYSEFIENLDYD